MAFTVHVDRVESAATRLAVEITLDGQPGTMLVPITLLNGNRLPAEAMADVCARA